MTFYVPGFDSDDYKIITRCRWTYETSDGSLSSVLDLHPPTGNPVPLHKVSQKIIAGWVGEQLLYTEKQLKEQIKYNKTCSDTKEAAQSYEVGPYLATASDYFFITEENARKAEEADEKAKEAAKAKVEAAKEAAKEKAKEKVKETVKAVAKKVKEVVDKNKPIVPIPAPEDDPVLK